MGTKEERIGGLRVFGVILKRYVFGVPRMRVLVLPVVVTIFLGKYFEIKVSECVTQVSKALSSVDDAKKEIFVYFSIFVISVLLSELQGVVFVGAVQEVYRCTLRNTFEYFVRMDTGAFDGYGSGKIQTVITRKSKAISEFIEVSLQNLLPVVLSFLLTSISVYKKLGFLAMAIVVSVIMLYGFITVSIALWRTRVRIMLNKAENSASNVVSDSMSNHEVVVSLCSYDEEIRKYDGCLVDVEKSGVRLFMGLYVLNMLQKLIFALMNTIVVLLGVQGFLSAKMSTDMLMFYFTTSRTLMSNLNNLGYTYCKLAETALNAREVLSEDHECRARTGVSISGFEKNIVFKDVHLWYGEKRILRGVGMNIMKGEKIALIGQNGCGKSTVLRALLRFCDYEGTICIDGVEIRGIEDSAFRKMVGYIPQNPVLFNDTVMYNIKYGNPGVSDDEVMSLAQRFNFHEGIAKLEHGYLTKVGECGRNVSGGERQKMSVLRALLRGADVLVMDEPTSSFDRDSEYEMMETIVETLGDTTVLAIVHNLNLLRFFDRICLVEDGVVKTVAVSQGEIPEALLERLEGRGAGIKA